MKSAHFKGWYSIPDPKRCSQCKNKHGTVYEITEIPNPSPPLHMYCRCIVQPLNAIAAGQATNEKINGADWWLKMFHKLPDYYLTWQEARNLGWNPSYGNLAIVAPGKMLTRGIYRNANRHLPDAPGRIWYEADINYTFGWRGSDRIIYSNDGLVFVTYDHYGTFEEIVQ